MTFLVNEVKIAARKISYEKKNVQIKLYLNNSRIWKFIFLIMEHTDVSITDSGEV